MIESLCVEVNCGTIVPPGTRKPSIRAVTCKVRLLIGRKLFVDKAVPQELVTPIFPNAAPDGTTAVSCEVEITLNDVAGVPLNATAVTPTKPLPFTVTEVPGTPEDGLNELIVGIPLTVTVLDPEAVPQAFETVTRAFPETDVAPHVVVILFVP